MGVQQRFQEFIYKRHMIYLKKQRGEAAPWTDDPILQQYRFCNVYRQLDRTTVWLNKMWYPNFEKHELPFAAHVARLLNHEEPLTAIRPLLIHGRPWRTLKIKEALRKVKERGGTVRGNAYIVSTNGHELPFEEYLVNHVLVPLRKANLEYYPDQNLAFYCARLMQANGIGSFMAGQIIADLKFVHPDMTQKKVSDWWSFVVPGPGSKRGLNRLHGRLPHQSMPTSEFYKLFELADNLANSVRVFQGWSAISAQDVQNCLCEFDKYDRAFYNEGRPKQNYIPHSG